MKNQSLNPRANFGTLPVFLTAISTILGAILYLRFGYAVGHTGFLGALAIIFIGHLVTVPTAFNVGLDTTFPPDAASYHITVEFAGGVAVAVSV